MEVEVEVVVVVVVCGGRDSGPRSHTSLSVKEERGDNGNPVTLTADT